MKSVQDIIDYYKNNKAEAAYFLGNAMVAVTVAAAWTMSEEDDYSMLGVDAAVHGVSALESALYVIDQVRPQWTLGEQFSSMFSMLTSGANLGRSLQILGNFARQNTVDLPGLFDLVPHNVNMLVANRRSIRRTSTELTSASSSEFHSLEGSDLGTGTDASLSTCSGSDSEVGKDSSLSSSSGSDSEVGKDSSLSSSSGSDSEVGTDSSLSSSVESTDIDDEQCGVKRRRLN